MVVELRDRRPRWARRTFLSAALRLREPAPTTLQEVREGGRNGCLGEQALSWGVPVPT